MYPSHHLARNDLLVPKGIKVRRRKAYPCFMHRHTQELWKDSDPDPGGLHFAKEDRRPWIGLRGTCHGAEQTRKASLVCGQTGYGALGSSAVSLPAKWE